MALIKCPECGQTISDRARKCPRCGLPIAQGATAPRRGIAAHSAGSKSSSKLPYIVAAATLALLAIVAGIYLLNDKDSKQAPISSSAARNETATQRSASPTTPPVNFSLKGVMGGCTTSLTMSGKEGILIYEPNYSMTQEHEYRQRTVTLLSYVTSTNAIELEVKDDTGHRTGIIRGTLNNGTLQGEFINNNGGTSHISLE